MTRPSVFTITGDQRTAYLDAMRAILIDCARERRTITYSELASINPVAYLHPHSFTFTHLLRQVCGEEAAKGHGQLCALVVSKITGMPSGGYFRGLAVEGDSTEDIEARWRADLEQVFKRWEND
ncbi:MAG: hypothetical protein U0670_00045 [Anaerolineae bacterium]